MNDPNTTQQTEFVWRRLADPLKLGSWEADGKLWLIILFIVLLLGLFYAGWMYKRDSRTVGWRWATFMGVIRCIVYGHPAPNAAQADIKSWLKPVLPTEPEDVKEEEKAAFRKKRELYQRLLGATNVGDSVLTAVNRELNNMVQAVIVFSDGHSTEGS